MMLVMIVVMVLVQALLSQSAESSCSKPCICNVPGYTLDFSKVQFPSTLVKDSGGFHYAVNPCQPVECSSKLSVVCQYGAHLPSSKTPHNYSCGLPNDASMVLHQKTPLNFTVTYSGGEGGRSSVITFTEVQSQSTISVTGGGVGGALTYVFTVTGSQVGSLHVPSSGVSAGVIGIVLMVLTIAGLATYFIAGILFMYFVRGARGEEMIPNLTFWKLFPLLIKDGFVFTFGPCVRALTHKASYEKI